MSRFCVYAHPDGPGYLLDVQANLLDHLSTRMVVPLQPAVGIKPARGLHPVFKVAGEDHVMMTHLMAAVPKSLIAAPVILNLASQQHEIVGALDILFQGV